MNFGWQEATVLAIGDYVVLKTNARISWLEADLVLSVMLRAR